MKDDTVVMYRGKLLSEMSKEELITIISELNLYNKKLIQEKFEIECRSLSRSRMVSM